MQENDESVWKSQEDEPMRMTVEELCARASAYEKENVRGYWILFVLAVPMVGAFAHNFVRITEPWVRVGNVYVGVIFSYVVWTLLRKGPNRRLRLESGAAEPCASFLRREFASKRESLRSVRWMVAMIFPGMVASWYGGGPRAMSKLLGIESSAYLRFQESPWLLIVFAGMLGFIWFAFGKEARKIDQEIEKLGGQNLHLGGGLG